ncbi:TIGR02270 family protein [Aliikangiella sp. IMCC44359]|uniref:TIGR02270 family protein n=1 Tax=Aliikangiella sp. IMCC44359 TaxID=3459125 RepID=UPI00403AFCB1
MSSLIEIDYLQERDPFAEIIQEHVEELASLWERRAKAVKLPNHNITNLKKLESRMLKHLAALRLNVEDSWTFSWDALERYDGGGEVFVAAILAFEENNNSRIEKIIQIAFQNNNALKGLISVFGWLPQNIIHPWIKTWLYSDDLNEKYLAIVACSVRRENPGSELARILSDRKYYSHQLLYARSLRLAGELKHQNLSEQVARVAQYALSQNYHLVSFWGCWTSILLGNKKAVDNMKNYVFSFNPYQTQAIEIVFRRLPINKARTWIRELAKMPAQKRQAIRACAVLGDPQSIPWLIQKMQQLPLARIAGEAFTSITGIELDSHHLALPQPPVGWAAIEEQIEDSEDDNNELELSYLEEDSFLVWPDPDKVAEFWKRTQHLYQDKQPYLLGKIIAPEHLKLIQNRGMQRYRRAAALALALNSNCKVYMNTSARVLADKISK